MCGWVGVEVGGGEEGVKEEELERESNPSALSHN